MGFLTINSDGGPLSFVGRVHPDHRRPALLAVSGAFPPQAYLHDLPTKFPGANVLVLCLPGMTGSFWADKPDVRKLTASLDRALPRLLGDVPIVALGISAGNLLTLGLRSANIQRHIAVEPFFRTKDLWPFIADSRARLVTNAGFPPLPPFLWEFFGIGPDGVEDRDYRHLLDGITTPTDVLVGCEPLLPQREMTGWPSFTSAEDRALLAANPQVAFHVGPPGSGHEYGGAGPGHELMLRLAHKALHELDQLGV